MIIMGAPADVRVTTSTLTEGSVIAVVRDGDRLTTTRRKTGVLRATVTGKTAVATDSTTFRGRTPTRYVIHTDQGDTVPVFGHQTFPLISVPGGPAATPVATEILCGCGTTVPGDSADQCPACGTAIPSEGADGATLRRAYDRARELMAGSDAPLSPRVDKRVRVETFRGRRLRVEKGREWGTLVAKINGEVAWTRTGVGAEAFDRVAEQLRCDVIFADEKHVTDPDAYPAHYFTGAPALPTAVVLYLRHVAAEEAARRALDCTNPEHAPGVTGCDMKSTNCNGVPADAHTITTTVVPTGSQIGFHQVAQELAARLVEKLGGDLVAAMASGESDPYLRKDVRNFSIWQTAVAGRLVTFVHYEGRAALSGCMPYIAVMVNGEVLPDVGAVNAMQPAAQLTSFLAWTVAEHIKPLIDETPAPAVTPGPALVFSDWTPDGDAIESTPATAETLIADEINPWVEVNGRVVNWADTHMPSSGGNGCDQCAGTPLPGVLAPMDNPEGVQRCDQCSRYPGDLAAADALAALVGGVAKFYPAPDGDQDGPDEGDITVTFFGHWEDDRLVIESWAAGEVPDDRASDDEDTPEQGWWSATGTGSSVHVIEKALREQYETSNSARPVTVTVDNAGEWRIHKVGCRDIERDTAAGGASWTITAPDVATIVIDTYGDATRATWQQFAAPTVMPCAGDLPDDRGDGGNGGEPTDPSPDDSPAPSGATFRTWEELAQHITGSTQTATPIEPGTSDSGDAGPDDGTPVSSGPVAVSDVDQEDATPAPGSAVPPAVLPEVGELATVHGWQVRAFVIAVRPEQGRALLWTSGETSRVPLERITGAEVLPGDQVRDFAALVLAEPHPVAADERMPEFAALLPWTSGRPVPGQLVTAIGKLAGERRENVQLISRRVTSLGCGCWRIECHRPGPVQGAPYTPRGWVALMTGCAGRHEASVAVPLPTDDELAAAEAAGRESYADGVPAHVFPTRDERIAPTFKRLPVGTGVYSALITAYHRGFEAAAARVVEDADRAAQISARNATDGAEIAARNPAAQDCADINALGAGSAIAEAVTRAGELAEVRREIGEPGETEPADRWEFLGQVSSGSGSAEARARWARYVAAIRRVHNLADNISHDDLIAARNADPRPWAEKCAAYWDAYAALMAEEGAERTASAEPHPVLAIDQGPATIAADLVRRLSAESGDLCGQRGLTGAAADELLALINETDRMPRDEVRRIITRLRAARDHEKHARYGGAEIPFQALSTLPETIPGTPVRVWELAGERNEVTAVSVVARTLTAVAGTGTFETIRTRYGTQVIARSACTGRGDVYQVFWKREDDGGEWRAVTDDISADQLAGWNGWVNWGTVTAPDRSLAEWLDRVLSAVADDATWEAAAPTATPPADVDQDDQERAAEVADTRSTVGGAVRTWKPKSWITGDLNEAEFAELGQDETADPAPAVEAPEGRQVKRPVVGAYIWSERNGVCEVTAVHGRGGEDIGVRTSSGERLSLTRHPRGHWLVVPAPAVDQADTDDDTPDDDDPRSIYQLPVEAYAPQLDSDDDAGVTIRHDHEDGTVVEGSSRGDGVWEITKAHGLECRRGVIFKRNTRDRFADLSMIGKLAAALREAGHTVAVEIDDVWRPASEREDARAVRVSERAERLAERASKKFAEANTRRSAARNIADGMPFGEPVKVGHHSERAHRRAFERIEANDRASYAARDYAEELARRADAAQSNEASKHGGRAIMRRVETLKTDRRAWIRRLADTDKGTTGSARRCRLHIERLSEDIAFQLAKLGDMATSGAFVAWSADMVQRGDQVYVGGSWHEVARINRKGVSVRALYQWHTRDDITPVTWDQIHGRRRDGAQLDTPNGQAWPVDQAVQVARWADLVSRYQTCTSYDPGDQEEMRMRHAVCFAVRIVLGLHAMASAQEVAAYGEPDTVAGQRARAIACLAVFKRLEAGERVPDVAADVQPIGDTVPRWRMPAGDPVEVRPADLVAGDIVAGIVDRFSTMRTVSTSIVGPVTAAPVEYDRREAGSWVTVQVDGENHDVKSHRMFMAHRAGVR